jgi:hypothetical protein
MACHVSNFSDMILKFGPKTLWSILFPMELVALNLDLSRSSDMMFYPKHCLRLVVGLVKNPKKKMMIFFYQNCFSDISSISENFTV